MRYVFAVVLIFCFTSAFSQTAFEGKIIYRFSSETMQYSGQFTYYFSKPGIRVELSQLNRPSQMQSPEIVIINFDSGTVSNLSPDTKTYRVTALKTKLPLDSFSRKTVAGYETVPLVMEAGGPSRGFTDAFGSYVLYVANGLFYSFPDKYSLNPELWMIQKNKIVLSGEFFLPNYYNDQWNLNTTIQEKKGRMKAFVVDADTVITQKIDAALFSVPIDYKREDRRFLQMRDSVDSVVAVQKYIVDSAVQQAQKYGPRQKKKSPNSKGTIKSPALRRKDQ